MLKGLARVRSVLIKGFETMVMVSTPLLPLRLPAKLPDTTSLQRPMHRTAPACPADERTWQACMRCCCAPSKARCVAHAQARLLLEDPGCEASILADWEGLLARRLREWGLQPAILEAFSNGYRSACFLKDRVRSTPARLPQALTSMRAGACRQATGCC